MKPAHIPSYHDERPQKSESEKPHTKGMAVYCALMADTLSCEKVANYAQEVFEKGGEKEEFFAEFYKAREAITAQRLALEQGEKLYRRGQDNA